MHAELQLKPPDEMPLPPAFTILYDSLTAFYMSSDFVPALIYPI
jgi:hypothetical protein